MSPADRILALLQEHGILTLPALVGLSGYSASVIIAAILTLRSRGVRVTADPSPAGTVYRVLA